MVGSYVRTHTMNHSDRACTEYAEYTAAQERIALGKKSKKKEAAQRREEMVDMIADACVWPWSGSYG
jgi:hypothetical protein